MLNKVIKRNYMRRKRRENRQIYTCTHQWNPLCLLTLWVHSFEVHADLCTSLSLEVNLLVLAIWQPKTVREDKKKYDAHVFVFAHIPCVCTMYVQSRDSGALSSSTNIWLFVLYIFFLRFLLDRGMVTIRNQRAYLYEANNIQYVVD